MTFFDLFNSPDAGKVAIAVAVALAVLAVSLALFVFWLWMMVNAIMNNSLDSTQRVLWVLGMWFFPLVVTAVYYFAVYAASRGSSPRPPRHQQPPEDFTY